GAAGAPGPAAAGPTRVRRAAPPRARAPTRWPPAAARGPPPPARASPRSSRRPPPPAPVTAHRLQPARGAHHHVPPVEALAGHAGVAERKVVLHRIGRIEPAQPGGDLLGHLPVAAAAPGEPERAGHVLDVGVHRDEERGGRDLAPEPEVGRLAAHHPAEEEEHALAGASGRRAREPVAVPVREPVAREHRGEVLGEEAVDEALERRAHVTVAGREAGTERLSQRAVTDEDALGGEAERGEVARAVEAIAEALE